MAPAKKMGSNAKRAVVYRKPNEPMPARDTYRDVERTIYGRTPEYRRKYGGVPDVYIFYLTGDPNRGDGYTQPDGYTLTEYVLKNGGYSKEVKEFPRRRFKSPETLVNWLNRQSRFGAELVSEGILIKKTYGDEGVWQEARDYRNWQKREVYGVALVDDPDDDTGSTLYVSHPREIPGKVLKRSEKTFYGRDEADRLAENTRQSIHDTPDEYYFRIRQWKSEDKVPASRARMFGYDGRKMSIGETMNVNGYEIKRVAAPSKSSGSPQRKPAKKPASKTSGSQNRKTTPAKRNPTARRRC